MQWKRLVVIWLALVILPVWAMPLVHGQGQNGNSPEEKLTPAEEKEVKTLAETFSKRLQETHNLESIVKDLFVSDFMERYLKNEIGNLTNEAEISRLSFVSMQPLRLGLLKEASPQDWKRFYIASVSFLYFGFISTMSKVAIDDERQVKGIKPTDIYPIPIVTLVNSNPNLSNLIKKNGDQESAIRTLDEFRKAISTLEQAVAMMREHLAKNPPEQTAIFKKNLKLIEQKVPLMNPQIEVADGGNPGVLQGTRVISIQLATFLQLTVIKVNDRLQILFADFIQGP